MVANFFRRHPKKPLYISPPRPCIHNLYSNVERVMEQDDWTTGIFGMENPGNVTDDFCRIDLQLHSPGIWGKDEAAAFLQYSLPRLQLQLAIIFFLTQSLHLLLRRFHLPRLVSELLAGIILGPTLLGQAEAFQARLFPPEGDVFLDLLSKIGYIFFIFLSGVKMDPKTVLRTGVKAWTIGVLTVILPAFGGLYFTINFQKYYVHKYRLPAYKNLVAIQNLFPFPVVASLLVDLKIMNSELGRLALASALISDMVSNFIFTAVSHGRIGQMGFTSVIALHSSFLTLCLILFVLFVGRPIALWMIKTTPEGKPVARVHVILMSLLVLVTVLITDNVGLHYMYGPFILGLAVPDGPPLGSTLVDRLETIVSGLLAPLLITYCGMKVNLIELYDLAFIGRVWTTTSTCLGMKLISVFVPALCCRVPYKDAAALSFILCAQGMVQMSFYYHNFVNQTFDGETFSMLIVAILLQVSITNIMVKFLYDQSRMYTGYQKRDIQHTSHNSELRILTCAHRVDDILATRNILEASFPTKESPLAIYALHLVELAGRAHPLLIDHQLGQKSSGGTRTQKMIEVLSAFEQQYAGAVTVQQFTAMSLIQFMHHDICTLAFNKLASLIILPFHRKWNQGGKMILDSSSLRQINCDVLNMAPCSVAILVDRHKVRRNALSTYNIGVAFFGGTDDREALAYANRMVQSPNIHLTVVRFVAWDIYAGDSQWDAVLDAEILKETRMQSTHQHNIVYKEERVKDGAETALLVHAMEEAFDLIMVGRRHKDDTPQLLGLSEWNDLPELGPVGDMLAAADLSKPVSVLVVQHQVIKPIS